ncbi:MAG: sugar phosphate isomerase/epimerase [Lachnospiraceae bacterium]|nr:sugar phosphate isomerase/epimerase [Lachnospiraceae bacterium]
MITFGMPALIELNTLEEHCALCASLGLKFIEINMSFPLFQAERLDSEELERLSSKYGIFFTIHVDEAFDPANVNDRIARVYLDNILETISLAVKAGIPTLNMHLLRGIYVTLPHKRVFIYGENEDLYLEKMRRFRDLAEEAIGDSPVRICVENTDGYQEPFLLHALDLLLESPVFGLTVDIGHDHAIKGQDLPVILEREPRLSHMHMHDAVGTNPHLALGDGQIDLEYYLNLAEKDRCRVVLETKTIEALKTSVAFLKERGRI